MSRDFSSVFCARFTIIIAIALFCMAFGKSARADISGMVEIVGGLDNPIFVTHVPGDRERLFIVEESGAIRVFNFNTGLNSAPFLTIPNVDTTSEGGILGLAFHPQYSTADTPGFGKFYVYATIDPNDNSTAPEPFLSHIREYTVSSDPNVANATPREILSFLQPQANHNGGWIGFGPNDGYLYINFGDGGGDDDNDGGHTPDTGNSQDLSDNFLGKTLRIDVNVPEGNSASYLVPPTNPFFGPETPEEGDKDDEIWAYGLRNPFRASFDRLSGDFWIGDVGQNTLEEVDFQPANSPGGENYGWRLREGNIATPSGGVGGAPPPGNVEPLYVYDRGTGEFQGFTVIGGYVYRGPDPELQGKYIFADAGSRHVWSLEADNPLGTRDNMDDELGAGHDQLNQPVSFGEDAVGNLYLVDYGSTTSATGQIFRIVTDALIAGDYNADGFVDGADFLVWKAAFGRAGGLADGNGDGTVNGADYTVWRDNSGRSVHDSSSSASRGGSNVPEPAGILLLIQLAAVFSVGRHYRRRICQV